MIINIDKDLCTGCRHCAQICPVDAVEGNKGEAQSINSELCVNCGQCVQTCYAYASPFNYNFKEISNKARERQLLSSAYYEPIFACHYQSHEFIIKNALEDERTFCAVQIAPAVRFALAEDFNLSPEVIKTGHIIAALKKLGFDYVYDTNFAADLTVIEEGAELLQRIQNNDALPLFTSCCPAWVKFVEQTYPQLINNLSSCKSPQQMAGAIFKQYGYTKIKDREKNKVFVASVMPCTAKKYECARPEMEGIYGRDVDAVITTRELAHLIKEYEIDLTSLEEEVADNPLGNYSGAGAIFGTTGGVTEAVLRTVVEKIEGTKLEHLEFHEVRGMSGVRRANINIGNRTFKIIIAAGLKNAASILDDLIAGKEEFHFMEVMACPAGCISGGGQPKILMEPMKSAVYRQRTAATYNHDKAKEIRKAHENPAINDLYENYLGTPNSPISHELLHTHYTVRRKKQDV